MFSADFSLNKIPKSTSVKSLVSEMAMERNTVNLHSIGSIKRRPMFCSFSLVTLLCFASWFLILGTTNRPISRHYESLPNTTIMSTADFNKHIQFSSRDSSSLFSSHRRCDPTKATLKVFMYDLPPEFHFGLLGWKPERDNQIWPDVASQTPHHPGGLNLQHSVEYWLTLDLLSSTYPQRNEPCTAVRVENSQEADVLFVPFFSSLSYNRHSTLISSGIVTRNQLLQEKMVEFLMVQEEWKRSGGYDHIILAHHPNSMFDVRMKLWPCMFILSDFGRYPPNVANVNKDIIAPYKHMIKQFINDSTRYDDRPILLFFQGAIQRKDGGFIRRNLFKILKHEKDVHFSFGSVRDNGIRNASSGMHSSKFCLNIAGDTPSSNRLFDAIASHCVPVIVSDEIELPFEDVLDYSEFCVFVRTSDALKKGFLVNLVQNISKDEWTRMWNRLKQVEGYFEYQYPSLKDDAVQMIWQAVARKVHRIKLKLNRSRRFAKFEEKIKI